MSKHAQANACKTQTPLIFTCFCLISLLLHTLHNKLIINPIFQLNGSFKWASASGHIIDNQFFFDFQKWELQCVPIDTSIKPNGQPAPKERPTIYSLILAYTVTKPYYLVRQADPTLQTIALNDRILYTSPVSPIEIVMFEGQLINPEETLCDVKGLQQITDALNLYNSIQKKQHKLLRLETRLEIFPFEETKAKIFQIRNYIYSNQEILKNLKYKPENFHITYNDQMISEMNDQNMKLYEKVLNIVKTNFINFLKTITPNGILRTQMFEKYFQPIQLKMLYIIQNFQNQDYQQELKDLSKYYLNSINFYMQSMLKRKRNLLFEILYFFVNDSPPSFHAETLPLKEVLSGLFQDISNHLRLGYNQTYNDDTNFQTNQLNKDFYETIEMIKSLPADVLKDPISQEFLKKKNHESLLAKENIYKIKRFYSMLSRTRYKVFDQVKIYISLFFKKYVHEHKHFRTLSEFDLINSQQNLNLYRFWKFSRYIGQNAYIGFSDDSYKISLFANQKAQTFLLV